MTNVKTGAYPKRLYAHDEDNNLQFGDKYWLAACQMAEVLRWANDTYPGVRIAKQNMIGYMALNYGISEHYTAGGAFYCFAKDNRFSERREEFGHVLAEDRSSEHALPLERAFLSSHIRDRDEVDPGVLDSIEGSGTLEVGEQREVRHGTLPAIVPSTPEHSLVYMGRPRVEVQERYVANEGPGFRFLITKITAFDSLVVIDGTRPIEELTLRSDNTHPIGGETNFNIKEIVANR